MNGLGHTGADNAVEVIEQFGVFKFCLFWVGFELFLDFFGCIIIAEFNFPFLIFNKL